MAKGKVSGGSMDFKGTASGLNKVDKDAKKAGQSLCQYVTEAVKNKTRPIGNLHTDQSFMNHWRAQNIHYAYLLPIKWNYMVDCHERTFNYKDYNFVHYAGWKGRTTLIQDYSKGIIE